MKKIKLIIIVCFMAFSAMAQVPQTINYQAVARNNAGVALANQTMQVRLSIMKGANSLYSETRTVTTNPLGLFNVQIGSVGATSSTGNFNAISWPNNQPDNKSIKVELDITNTNIFTDMGTQELASVPYSFAAGEAINAMNIGGHYVDTNPPNTGDILKWNGTAWVAVRDTTIAFYKPFVSVSAGGGSTPWVFASTAGNLPTITVNGNETIIATLMAGLQNSSGTGLPCAVDVCFQDINAGTITSFSPGGSQYNDYSLPSGSITPITAVGTVKLPAGTYRIGLAIKNKSLTAQTISSPVNFVQGVIQVKQ